MDFPNVTHIIQIGLPKSSDDYVHRLGRTGRAGKSGEGWLIINSDEKYEYRKRMGHSGIKVDEAELPSASLDMTKSANLPARTARIMQMIETGVRSVSFGQKSETYRSLLNVMGQFGRRKQDIIDLMNELARYGWGLERPPALDSFLVNKLGFSHCTGIEIGPSQRRNGDRDNFERRGGQGGFGRERQGFNERDPFGANRTVGLGASRGYGDRDGDRSGGRGGFQRFDHDRGRDGGYGGRREGGRRSSNVFQS